MSLLTIKRPESYAVVMSSITLSLGVEFTNSYHEHVHSTSHFDAHFPAFDTLYSIFDRKTILFGIKNFHLMEFSSTRWK